MVVVVSWHCCFFAHLLNYKILLAVFFFSFRAGTIAEGAPVVPISAQLKYNIEVICEFICKKIPVPDRDFSSSARLIGVFSVAMIKQRKKKTWEGDVSCLWADLPAVSYFFVSSWLSTFLSWFIPLHDVVKLITWSLTCNSNNWFVVKVCPWFIDACGSGSYKSTRQASFLLRNFPIVSATQQMHSNIFFLHWHYFIKF